MKNRKLKKSPKMHSRKINHRHTGIFCGCQGRISLKYIAIGGVAILTIVAIGYFMFKGNSSSLKTDVITNNATNPSGKTTENEFANIKDPILRKYYIAQWNIKKVRTKMFLSYMKGATSVYEYEIIEGLFSGKSNISGWIEQNGKREAEYIIIGYTTYVKDYSDNKWWKQTKTEEAEFKNILKKPTPDPFKEAQKIGEEPCPNIIFLLCYKYSEISTFIGRSSKSIYWFDKKDYLLRKQILDDGGDWSEYEYNNINIKAPSLTKDVPEGKDISEYIAQNYISLPGIFIPKTRSTEKPPQ